MKMFFIDVENAYAECVVDVEPTLETYYKMLNCNTIDITERCVGGVYYDFICDDEGLFVENNCVSAFNSNKEPMLVGNLLICLHNGEGEEVGLTDLDCKLLKQHLQHVVRNDGKHWNCLVGVEY